MPIQVIQQNEPNTLVATIAAAGSLSAALHIPNGHEVVALLMPAVWTAAGITFQASADKSAFGDVFAAGGTEYTLTVVATNYVVIPTGSLHGARYIKVRSGTTGTPVAQAAERTITIVTKPTA